MSDQTAIAGPNARNWDSASRPSKTNCTTADSESLPAGEGSWQGYWWKEKNALVDEFVGDFSERAARPVSVRGGTKLREECTSEKREGGHRSKSWSDVLNEFLKWYNDYRHAHLVFDSPEGETVRSQMPNSHQPEYGDKYYARLKALERQITAEYDDLQVAMLTLTGSMRNARGGWRCPADHLRDVIDTWRPDRGRGVYHALRDALEGKRWEYTLVVEKHQNGYGHVHVAVFVDGSIEESDFHPVIDCHLRKCDIAHRDAHDYHHPDPEKRPISVREVDADLDPDEYESTEDVGNVGSYIGEYVGAYGNSLFERSIEELAFRAVTWSTGTQVVRFSAGANQLINEEFDRISEDQPGSPPCSHPDSNSPKSAASESDSSGQNEAPEGWTLGGIGRVDSDGESIHRASSSGVQWVDIADDSYLDPPRQITSDRPKERLGTSE
ncbi:replication protein [Salinarchaeum laminariae]|uniref:replication protein n=1 Tax=Salinarchaeum laminariae TaxID=869888 RepID=UPI0020C0DE2A|nr:replication protein [Salinarchaeum laminariae]